MLNSVLTLREQQVFMFEFAVVVLDLWKGTNGDISDFCEQNIFLHTPTVLLEKWIIWKDPIVGGEDKSRKALLFMGIIQEW